MEPLTREELLEHCLEIAEEYLAQGLKLTLRQMYYQLVSRALIPNGQNHYNRVGTVLTDARYNGTFPLDVIEDRGRTVGKGDYDTDKSDFDESTEAAKRYLTYIPEWVVERSRWWLQPHVVSVWVEKEALSGVFHTPCKDLGVSMFACKGYPSVSSLNTWLDQMIEVRDMFSSADNGMEPTFTILYFGDHDPDGMEIPESADRNLHKLMNVKGEWIDISWERVALNMDQIRQFNPPPFPAKQTSSRYKKYLREQNTNNAWELDALEPRVLQRLIRENVENYFDEDIYEDNKEAIKDLRLKIKKQMCSPDFVKKALGM